MTTRTWRAKRRIGAAALVALIGSTLAFASPVTAEGHEDSRLAGADRYETAAALAVDRPCLGAAAVVNGSNFPDGLAAASTGLPVLLVQQDAVPAATAEYLEWCAGHVVVIGGESVVSPTVVDDIIAITGGGTVERLAGDDRYSTAVAVAEWGGGACDVILATGENFPDALAAGSLSFAAQAPILLTSGSALRADVKAWLGDNMGHFGDCDLDVPTVHIIGGTSAVPASIETEINTMGIDTNRIAGANRYETAAAVAETLEALQGGSYCAVLVNGNGFADALAAGPWAGWYACSIQLTKVDSIPATTAAWHASHCEGLAGRISVAGGTAVVSEAVHVGAIAAATCTPVELTAMVSTTDAGNVTWTVWNASAGGCDSDTVRLTGIDGSGAGGFDGNGWVIDVNEGDVTAVTELNYDTEYLEVSIDVDAEDGMTAAQFVEIWNGLSEANLLFEASVGTLGAADSWDTTDGFCVDEASTDDLEGLGTQAPFVQQSVTVTFNQAVTKCGGGAVDIDDVDIYNGPGGYAITGDGTVFTITMDPATSAGNVLGPDNGNIEMDDDNGVCSAEFPSVENDGEEIDFS